MRSTKIVTAIKPRKKGNNRVNLFLDGRFTLSLSASVLGEAGIQTGQSLSQFEVENLEKADLTQAAIERARRYISYRPRSESEVRARLERYGYGDDIVSRTLQSLRNSGLTDDAYFGMFWKENRANFRPCGSRLIVQELRRKGISSEVITEIAEGIDNDAEAYRAGYKKARLLLGADYQVFRRKLGAFLHRRGFDYEVIEFVVDRLWQEQEKERNSNDNLRNPE